MSPRNKPCQCGSGKKFKKCCGSPAAILEQCRIVREKWLEQRREQAAERERETLEFLRKFPGAVEINPPRRGENEYGS